MSSNQIPPAKKVPPSPPLSGSASSTKPLPLDVMDRGKSIARSGTEQKVGTAAPAAPSAKSKKSKGKAAPPPVDPSSHLEPFKTLIRDCISHGIDPLRGLQAIWAARLEQPLSKSEQSHLRAFLQQTVILSSGRIKPDAAIRAMLPPADVEKLQAVRLTRQQLIELFQAERVDVRGSAARSLRIPNTVVNDVDVSLLVQQDWAMQERQVQLQFAKLVAKVLHIKTVMTDEVCAELFQLFVRSRPIADGLFKISFRGPRVAGDPSALRSTSDLSLDITLKHIGSVPQIAEYDELGASYAIIDALGDPKFSQAAPTELIHALHNENLRWFPDNMLGGFLRLVNLRRKQEYNVMQPGIVQRYFAAASPTEKALAFKHLLRDDLFLQRSAMGIIGQPALQRAAAEIIARNEGFQKRLQHGEMSSAADNLLLALQNEMLMHFPEHLRDKPELGSFNEEQLTTAIQQFILGNHPTIANQDLTDLLERSFSYCQHSFALHDVLLESLVHVLCHDETTEARQVLLDMAFFLVPADIIVSIWQEHSRGDDSELHLAVRVLLIPAMQYYARQQSDEPEVLLAAALLAVETQSADVQTELFLSVIRALVHAPSLDAQIIAEMHLGDLIEATDETKRHAIVLVWLEALPHSQLALLHLLRLGIDTTDRAIAQLSVLTKVVQSQPTLGALLHLAKLSIVVQNVPDTIAWMEKAAAVATNADERKAITLLHIHFHQLGREAEQLLLNLLLKLKTAYPDLTVWNSAYDLELGWMNFFDHDLKAAESAAKRAIKINKTNIDALELRARIAIAQKQLDKAIGYLTEAQSIAPLPHLQFELGRCYLALDDDMTALAILDVLAKTDPTFPRLDTTFAALYSRTGDPEQHLDILLRLNQKTPKAIHLEIALALCFTRLGQYRRSRDAASPSHKNKQLVFEADRLAYACWSNVLLIRPYEGLSVQFQNFAATTLHNNPQLVPFLLEQLRTFDRYYYFATVVSLVATACKSPQGPLTQEWCVSTLRSLAQVMPSEFSGPIDAAWPPMIALNALVVITNRTWPENDELMRLLTPAMFHAVNLTKDFAANNLALWMDAHSTLEIFLGKRTNTYVQALTSSSDYTPEQVLSTVRTLVELRTLARELMAKWARHPRDLDYEGKPLLANTKAASDIEARRKNVQARILPHITLCNYEIQAALDPTYVKKATDLMAPSNSKESFFALLVPRFAASLIEHRPVDLILLLLQFCKEECARSTNDRGEVGRLPMFITLVDLLFPPTHPQSDVVTYLTTHFGTIPSALRAEHMEQLEQALAPFPLLREDIIQRAAKRGFV